MVERSAPVYFFLPFYFQCFQSNQRFYSLSPVDVVGNIVGFHPASPGSIPGRVSIIFMKRQRSSVVERLAAVRVVVDSTSAVVFSYFTFVLRIGKWYSVCLRSKCPRFESWCGVFFIHFCLICKRSWIRLPHSPFFF